MARDTLGYFCVVVKRVHPSHVENLLNTNPSVHTTHRASPQIHWQRVASNFFLLIRKYIILNHQIVTKNLI